MATERYLEEWRTADLITAEQHALLLTIVRRQRFAVFLELNALLYLGVVAIAGGIGWTLREHFATAGDAVVFVTLAAIFAGCLWYCFTRALPFSPEQVAAPTFSFDYILYLVCRLLLAKITYLEYRIRLLGVDWHYYLLSSASLYVALPHHSTHR